MGFLTTTNNRNSLLLEQKEHITKDEYFLILDACMKRFDQTIEQRKGNNTMIPEYIRDRDYFLIMFLWNTGARIGDVCRLTTKNVNTYNNSLTFTVEKLSKKDKAGNFIEEKKHTVYLEDSFINKYHNYVNKWKIDGPLFRNTRDMTKHITPKTARVSVSELAKIAGIERNIHPHLFRHGIAVYLVQNGVQIEVISKFLAHSSTETTLKFYARISPELVHDVISSKVIIN